MGKVKNQSAKKKLRTNFFYNCKKGSLIDRIEINFDTLTIYPKLKLLSDYGEEFKRFFFDLQKVLPPFKLIRENSPLHGSIHFNDYILTEHLHLRFQKEVDLSILNKLVSWIDDLQNNIDQRNQDKKESLGFWGRLFGSNKKFNTEALFLAKEDVTNIVKEYKEFLQSPDKICDDVCHYQSNEPFVCLPPESIEEFCSQNRALPDKFHARGEISPVAIAQGALLCCCLTFFYLQATRCFGRFSNSQNTSPNTNSLQQI